MSNLLKFTIIYRRPIYKTYYEHIADKGPLLPSIDVKYSNQEIGKNEQFDVAYVQYVDRRRHVQHSH